MRVARQSGVELMQRRTHLVLHAGDEPIAVERQSERRIVVFAFRGEVGRQILIRVAVAVGTDDPDLERNRSRSASSTQIS
jgi:hypothetical protein